MRIDALFFRLDPKPAKLSFKPTWSCDTHSNLMGNERLQRPSVAAQASPKRVKT